MAQRLSSDERARTEAMRAAGSSVDDVARRLGRHRSTVYRELERSARGAPAWGGPAQDQLAWCGTSQTSAPRVGGRSAAGCCWWMSPRSGAATAM